MKRSLTDAIIIAYNKSIAPENTRWQTTHSGTRQVTAGRGTAHFKNCPKVIQNNLSFLHSIVILQSHFVIVG